MWTEDATGAIKFSVEGDPNDPLRHQSQQLGMHKSTRCKILLKYLGLCAYKIQLVHELKPLDNRDRDEWAENQIALDPAFKSKILFTDEAHFWLSGYRNMLIHKSMQIYHRL